MTPSSRPVVVRGRIRDEFQCPITAQILRDPVVAKDGHTYERSAITTWLETHKTSPMTKEEISSADLVPNLNLKRLIADLVAEGGQGLAAKPTTAEELAQETAFGFDDVLMLRCLGPAESDWMNRIQVVTKDGISGGRRRNSTGGKESMVFQDTTVSRRHFEAGWGVVDEAGKEGFYIQDLGSAGGTYLRLRHWEAMGLRDGAMILVGKHQFLVLAPSRLQELQQPAPQQQTQQQTQPMCIAGGSGGNGLPRSTSSSSIGAAGPTTMEEASAMSSATLGGAGAGGAGAGANAGADAGLGAVAAAPHGPHTPTPTATAGGGGVGGGQAVANQDNDASVSCAAAAAANGVEKSTGALIQAYLQRPKAPLVEVGPDGSERPLMYLKCFAPEGSPMQHRVFAIGASGATIGRKQSNTVSLSQEKGGEVLGLDSAVSGEHCRIEYSGEREGFVLLDGAKGVGEEGDKPSTNGTWARLSYMQMMSPRQVLERDDEILVGGILRFAVSFESYLMEGVPPPRVEEVVEEEMEGEMVAAGTSGTSTGSGGGGAGGQAMLSDGESSTPRSRQENDKVVAADGDGREEAMDIA